MKNIITRYFGLEKEPEMTFFASGALNRLYAFDCQKGRYLMRVTLPAAPKVKTSSETATLNFIREKTSIPVPRVLAYNLDPQNELGFEWMIIERVDAQPLLQAWHGMEWHQKQLLVQQLAAFWVQLFGLRLSGIGSIQPPMASNGYLDQPAQGLTIGEIV